MYHLKVPVLLLLLLVLLQCVTTAPNYRYSSSSAERPGEAEGWMAPGLSLTPFLEFAGSRPQRGLSALNSQQHHIEKRRCNTATCVTQRLADYLVRSSNTMGTVYSPTNVGSSTYGKREVFQSRSSAPL
ncbi:islet amyloid polypeptide [Astyanax mexicanus]|uniref:Islet amyloid polypeptide n=2 Tax=Astyanax mexicanus TaxID=7994 RepID=A0A8B9K5G9_ASTMX|nr:islet amyloid polypeptide [Astyanax mexicanus]